MKKETNTAIKMDRKKKMETNKERKIETKKEPKRKKG